MGAGRRAGYNPRTGKRSRPKPRYARSGKKRKKGGCYIATAVYGSYDCPEVRTLRRYRDDRLSKQLCGRVFIKTYYAVSPVIVRLFGKARWFNRLSRSALDSFVAKLNARGYASGRYEAAEW